MPIQYDPIVGGRYVDIARTQKVMLLEKLLKVVGCSGNGIGAG
jgi:hypothetical protein